MNQFTFNYKIVYYSGTITGGELTVQAVNKDLAEQAVMNRLIDNLRKEGKSGNLKEIIIL